MLEFRLGNRLKRESERERARARYAAE